MAPALKPSVWKADGHSVVAGAVHAKARRAPTGLQFVCRITVCCLKKGRPRKFASGLHKLPHSRKLVLIIVIIIFNLLLFFDLVKSVAPICFCLSCVLGAYLLGTVGMFWKVMCSMA